ncbi:hypothetical protein MTY66_63820 (plasmid) [Mycolicibacterium sp. TY66]|uniref:hypothetical protein n=1 Tax=unclassified Mycolicibacterium TaxID=2636767 RepID=UPI001BB3C6FF|nr:MULTISPECIES: hypothetical protein [unclassified Mycolicibacterium]BCI84757.1 hypothetical protein MTY66_63820 [Mycolicibacterium sp. TY66]BCJ84971.1 hypothetical protein MTY81_63440 [Mycolicibacterium sp. TY81]
MAPVIKVNAQTMLSAKATSVATAMQMAQPAAGGVPKIAPGSPVDGVLMAVSADIAVVSTALASVFVGQGPKVETATTDGVMRFQNQDEQSQQLLRQVGESATASGTVYTL